MLYLKVLRVKAGLTQKDLAREFGMTVSTVRRWERGEYLPPTKKLLAMAAKFGCAVADLVQDVPKQHEATLRREFAGTSEY